MFGVREYGPEYRSLGVSLPPWSKYTKILKNAIRKSLYSKICVKFSKIVLSIIFS